MAGLSPLTVSRLCYFPGLGAVLSLLILTVSRFRPDGWVRFHAFQGLYLFLSWLVTYVSLVPFLNASAHYWVGAPLLHLTFLIVSLFLFVKTGQGELVRLPLLGELAARSAGEHSASGRA